jgi:hypothetical protein
MRPGGKAARRFARAIGWDFQRALGALFGLWLAAGVGCADESRGPLVDASSAEDVGFDGGADQGASDGGGHSDAGGNPDGVGGSEGGAPPDVSHGPGGFTVIALPDTQYYAESYPDIFEAQVRWILDNRQKQHIAFVVHEGDIVDIDTEKQWEVAATALHKLDGVVPYALAAGNHDYLSYGIDDRGTLINKYFPVAGFASLPWWLGTFEPEHVEDNAQLLRLNDQDWLVLSLEFGPRDTALAWAASVLEAHPTTPAILVTHAYLYVDGTRYDHQTRSDQRWSPYSYWSKGGSPPPGTCNDGEEMWQKLVRDHENVRFVISGHVFNLDTGEAAAALSSTRPSGSVVHQIVANYQNSANGGNGYLRIMAFDETAKTLKVSTYSPSLDRWKRDPANEFTLPLP